MNKNISIDYDPKASIFVREQTKGNKKYWIKYYLPTGERVRRPLCASANEAKRLFRMKEIQLLKGEFDSKDQAKMLNLFPESVPKKELTLDQAMGLYLEATSSRKKAHTLYNDQMMFRHWKGYFSSKNCSLVKEVDPLLVQLFVNQLDQEKKTISTVRNHVNAIKKLYNWLIDEVRLFEGVNPVPKRFKLPQRGAKVRDRLATDEEIKAIFSVLSEHSVATSSKAPIAEIVKFLVFTGARLGEVLHAEWGDFDLEQGIWQIRYKPNCPTKEGTGWSPKWNKPRTVKLFDEAVQILEIMPRRKSFGVVLIRDKQRRIVRRELVQAEFVFPKEVVRLDEKGHRHVHFERVDSIKKGWATVKEQAGIENLQLKDLRTFTNHLLKSRYGFSAKEAGSYLGNSAEINDLHYTPISNQEILRKMEAGSLSDVIGL